MKGFYTVRQVCDLLKVARETLRRWEKAGIFPKRVALSGHARGRKGYRIEDIETWSQQLR
jgi:DNA-binding transcriptional MerR regulator